MSPSELKDRETRAWLAKAEGDLASAVLLAGANQEDNSLYHCQQTAEKSLKAFLVWHGQPFRRTHDLEEIGKSRIALDETLRAIAEEADSLTDFAWRARYPGNPYVLEDGALAAMLDLATRVPVEVKTRLSAAARPGVQVGDRERSAAQEP